MLYMYGDGSSSDGGEEVISPETSPPVIPDTPSEPDKPKYQAFLKSPEVVHFEVAEYEMH